MQRYWRFFSSTPLFYTQQEKYDRAKQAFPKNGALGFFATKNKNKTGQWLTCHLPLNFNVTDPYNLQLHSSCIGNSFGGNWYFLKTVRMCSFWLLWLILSILMISFVQAFVVSVHTFWHRRSSFIRTSGARQNQVLIFSTSWFGSRKSYK